MKTVLEPTEKQGVLSSNEMSKVQSIVNKHSVEPQPVKVNVSINVYTVVVKGEFRNNCAFLLGKGCEERQKEFKFCGLQTK